MCAVVARAQRRLGQLAVGRGPDEVAGDADEDPGPAVAHGPDGVHGVPAVPGGRSEAELPLQGVQEILRHALPDAHGAVALYVAVAAHRAHARSRLPDVPAQHQEVDDLADGGHAVLVLGQAHRPADDDAPAPQHPLVHLLDLFAGQPRGLADVVPVGLAGVPGELGEARGAGVDELVVQHGPRRVVLGLQQQQVQRLEQREVAAGPDLQELVGDGRAAADDAAGLLGVLEPHQPGLGQRVHGDDLAAAPLGLLQRGEHPRVVGARVLAHDKDQVAVVNVVQGHAALADAQGLVERGTAGLVAHVAAVGQVVGAVGPGEELEQERGLVADPARGVEEGLVRGVQGAQFAREQVEGAVPADRLVVVRAGPLDHGFGGKPCWLSQ